MKIGEIEIEIESQEEQLQFAVEQILSTITNKFKDTNLLSPERPIQIPRAETCKGIIQKLWDENWFKKMEFSLETENQDDINIPKKDHHQNKKYLSFNIISSLFQFFLYS